MAHCSLFEGIERAPPDPIFNLNTAFNADTHPKKVNVGVGAYRTDEGKPWVLPVVKKAERLIIEDPTADHEYLPIDGLAAFNRDAAHLVLGENSPAIREKRYFAIQSISGTGSLRTAAAFLARYRPTALIYVARPTWGPHHSIFTDAGLKIAEYPYYDSKANRVDFEALCNCIQNANPGSVFVLHACAHNPTGMDPSMEQWDQLADLIKSHGIITLFDCAYQGFASGDFDKDAAPVRLFVEKGLEVFVAQSFSKNMGLYNERCGNLTVVCKSPEISASVHSQMCRLNRAIFSNPPAFGARIAARIMGDPQLFAEWQEQLLVMTSRIQKMREMLYHLLVTKKTPGNWDHIIKQNGMFSYTGLTREQSVLMRERFHIYLTDNGRISIAGLNTGNLEYFADSMDWVVRHPPTSL